MDTLLANLFCFRTNNNLGVFHKPWNAFKGSACFPGHLCGNFMRKNAYYSPYIYFVYQMFQKLRIAACQLMWINSGH